MTPQHVVMLLPTPDFSIPGTMTPATLDYIYFNTEQQVLLTYQEIKWAILDFRHISPL